VAEQRTLDERDIIIREQELAFREREVAATEEELKLKAREVTAREKELSKSRWTNPLVLSLLAAAVGLIGNVLVEHSRAQSTLILEASKTGNDQQAACKNLTFFVRLGFIDDINKTIAQACPGEKGNAVPTLPVSHDTQPSYYLRILVTDENKNPLPDASVHTQDRAGNGDNCKSNEEGFCILPPLPTPDALHIRVEKQGYKPAEQDITWTGSGIIVMVLSK
jgi:hypothetical protein